MFAVRRSAERGHFQHGWLDTYHTFSFAGYRDQRFVGFRALRVINEDRVQPSDGFGMHGHSDMEIITYVLSGALEHRDSLGNGEVIRPGELQHMTAGTGVQHSEFNPSETEPVHLYQIWLRPDRQGLEPSYAQRAFSDEERRNRLRVVASSDGRDGSLQMHQDAQILLASLDAGKQVEHRLAQGRHAWLQVLRGDLVLGEHRLNAGDGVAISDEPGLTFTATAAAETMLFDLA